MTQEEKDLLIKDLSARLSYSVKCYYEEFGGSAPIHTVTIGLFAKFVNDDGVICKPYLRPMSSMTDVEKEELRNYSYCPGYTPEVIDFFNYRYLDWRHLIEKGLALEAPEGMYN